MPQRRPNIARLARRQDVEQLIAALAFTDVISTSDGEQVDVGAATRCEAAAALGEIGDSEATRALTEVALRDPDPTVREATVQALDNNTEPDVLSALVGAVCGWREPVYQPARSAAIEHLQQVPTELAPTLARALVERVRAAELDEHEKWAVRELLAHDEQKAKACASTLVPWLNKTGSGIAPRSADTLVELAPWGENELVRALGDKSLAAHAAEVIARRRDGQAVERLTQLLHAETAHTRKAAALALGELRDPLATEALLAAINDRDHEVRVAAAEAVDKLGSIAVIASVANMLAPLVGDRQLFGPGENLRLGPGSWGPNGTTDDAAVASPLPEDEEAESHEDDGDSPDALQAEAETAEQREHAEEPDLEPADEGTHAEAPAQSQKRAATGPLELGRRSAILGLLGICIAAVLGFTIARTSGGSGHSHPTTAAPSRIYASELNTVISRLNGARTSAARQLVSAQTARDQSSAASKLAVAHSQAAYAILRLNAGTASRANSAVARALGQISDAYRSLALATQRGDLRGEGVARASLANANNALNSAFAQLRSLGYRPV